MKVMVNSEQKTVRLYFQEGQGIQWSVLIGVVLTLAIGEIVIRFAENHKAV